MPDRDFYILAYDIANDRRRVKIAKLMESQAERVQGSVFEAYLTPAELEKIIRRAAKFMNEKEDSLRVYFLCESCRSKVRLTGQSRLTPPPGLTII